MVFIARGGRPGLLGMAARTAVVAGTATAVSGAVARRQNERAQDHAAAQAEQAQFAAPMASAPPQAAPTAPAPPAGDLVSRLQELGALQQQGLLTTEEFALAKQQLLGS